METGASEETCARLETATNGEVVFVKGSWFPTHFTLFITDGLHAWITKASEKNVADRASQWDQSVSEYLEDAKHYLGNQQPGSIYSFQDAGNDHMRLSWTLEKDGTKLECRWKCERATNDQKVTRSILDFLMEANTKLSDEVVRKTRSFERMKVEAEKCLVQSEKFKNEKTEFEHDVYAKFVAVLNSKKAKLRELREKSQNLRQQEKAEDEDGEYSEEETDRESEHGENESSESKTSEDADTTRKLSKSKAYLAGKSKANTDIEEEKPTQKTNTDDAKLQNISEPAKNLVDEDEASVSAAGLLAVSNYTSAPKRRRRT